MPIKKPSIELEMQHLSAFISERDICFWKLPKWEQNSQRLSKQAQY